MKKIVICGLGYVGLTHLLGCWLNAHEVGANQYVFVGYDPDMRKVDKIMSGECPISEPGLSDVLAKALLDPDHFGVCSDPACWYNDPDVEMVFCCVGTPMSDDGSANMEYVYKLAEAFGDHIHDPRAIFINKSTSPVGTCQHISDIVFEKINKRYARCLRYASVLSNPEFLSEGTALDDMLVPDRIIIGGPDETSERLRKFYNSIGLICDGVNCVTTTWENAEIIKYASNAMLATRISFVNDLADLCEHTGANIQVVSECMGMDRRIGHPFLKAGPGYGGSCFPKDTRALLYQGASNGVKMRVVDAVIESNEYHRRKASDIVSELIGHIGYENIGTIGVIGAAFKSGTGDLRESPAVDLLRYLTNLNKKILVFDDNVSEEELSRAVPCDHPEQLIMSPIEEWKDCDLVIAMNQDYIVWPNPENSKVKAIVDMRCCIPDSIIEEIKNQGVIYVGHGRGDI